MSGVIGVFCIHRSMQRVVESERGLSGVQLGFRIEWRAWMRAVRNVGLEVQWHWRRWSLDSGSSWHLGHVGVGWCLKQCRRAKVGSQL